MPRRKAKHREPSAGFYERELALMRLALLDWIVEHDRAAQDLAAIERRS